MKLSSLNRALFASLLTLASLPLLSFLPLSKVHAASAPAAILPSSGKPLVSLRSPQTLKFEYAGSPEALAALESGRATPTALAQADFNADGAPDVVAGYSTEGGGVLTLLLGNPDAYAPKDTSLFQKAMRGEVPATFLSSGTAYALPESPDLIVTGDFNRDGHQDVLVAARGGNLYLLAGDGKGNLGAPKPVSLAGRVWAMAATGDGHVALSTDGDGGVELRILAPGAAGLTASARYPLPARGDAVLWGDLGGGADVAVGAGNHIAVIYNPLKDNAQTEIVSLPFKVEGLTSGDFIWDRDGRTEMAALAADGSVHILQHGTLDTRPLTPEDIPGRRAVLKEKRKQQRMDPTSLGSWTVAGKLPHSGSAPAGAVGPSAFNSPRLAASPTQDLMVLDGERSLLSILDTAGKTESRSADVLFSSMPVAALTLPQKINAGRDTVVLTAGQAAPMVLRQDGGGGDPAVTVNTTADTDGQGACGLSSGVTVSGLSGTISLRTAVCAVNNSGAGTYTINVPAGTYSLKNSFFGGKFSGSTPSGELQVGMESGENITISGAGAATTIIQQTDGVDRVIEADQVGAGGMPLKIQNVTLTGGTCSTGLDCGFSGGGLVAGAYTGDSLTLTSVTVSNNSEQADTPALGGGNQGGGVSMAGPAFTITNSTFSGNSVTASSTNSGDGGGVEFLDDVAGNLSITGSTFTGNTVAASTNEPAQGGGLWIDISTPGDTATISGSTFTGNQANGSNGQGGAIYTAGPTTVSNSRITGNTAGGGGSGFWEQGSVTSAADGTGTVTDNWWGCNGGPGASGCDTQAASPVSGDHASVVFNPWLVLSISANPTSIFIDATSELTAGITTNSTGGTGFTVPDGTAITFGGTLGAANPTSSTLTSGQATSTFTAGSTPGAGTGTAKIDNQTVTVGITIGDAPTITSAGNTTFIENTAATFTVTTTGFPVPALSKSGALPPGVNFLDNGNGTATLSGTATATGTFPLTITAANGFAPNAVQSFTLTVNSPQATLTISANPAAGGTVTPATGSVYTVGTVVPITATANSGYAFVNWTSSPDSVASTTSASSTIPMNANETVTAQFSANLVVNAAADDYPNDLSSKCTPQPTPGVNTIDTACSLRDAIDYANSAPATSITFSSTVFKASNTVAENSIVLGGSALAINAGTVTITGATSGSGATLNNLVTINGNLASTDFVVGTAVATFNNLNIVNGQDSSYYTTLGYGIAGGVYNNGGTVTINTSTISGNVDSPLTPLYVYGGGLLNYSGTMTVADSTISGNSAVASYSGFASYGGGIVNLGTLTVSNSTISGNSATSGSGAQGIGGGITNSGPLTVASSTISLNTTSTGAGGIYDVTETGTNPVTNSIISGNVGFSYPDVFDLGALQITSGDQITTGFALAPLSNYGGPTQTQPPLPGDPSFCGGLTSNEVAAGLNTDQRGFGFDPICPSGSVDSGAVQTHYTLGFNALPLNVIVGQVITPAPAVTLYESTVAVTAANSGGVTLSDSGATLSGTLTQTLVSGTATFPGVSFSSAAFQTQLMATLALNASVSITGTRGATVTVSPAPAVIAAPSTSSPLPGPGATFTWNAVTGANGYALWIGTTGPGSHNLYDSGEVTGTSLKFGNLPTNGSTIYVRLYTNYHGVAQPNDYVYTASTQAALTLPSSPGVLAGATVTFTWSAATGSGVTGYSLWLGSSPGANNLYESRETTALTATATKLPTNSSTVYARLYTNYNGVVRYADYTYTAAP